MEQFGFTAFDIAVAVILILSTVVALRRGLISETLSIAAWIGAGFITYQFFDAVLPKVKEAIPSEILAEAATAAVLFIVPLIVLRIISGLIARSIDGSSFGAVDKFLGLFFGVARGAALVAAGYLILSVVIAPNKQPPWIQEAYSLPYVSDGADWIESVLPEGMIERTTAEASRAVEGANDLRDQSQGYSEEQNQVIEKIIEGATSSQ